MVKRINYSELLDEFVKTEKLKSYIGSGDDAFYANQISDYVDKQRKLWIGFAKFIVRRSKKC